MAFAPALMALVVAAAHGLALYLVARRLLGRRGDRRLTLVPAVGQAIVALGEPRSPGRRAAALAAGGVASYLTLVAAAAGFAMHIGVESGQVAYEVSGVTPGSPADGVLAPGDQLLRIDGEAFQAGTGTTPQSLIQRSGGREVSVEYRRDRRTVTGRLTPRHEDGVYLMGVRLAPEGVAEPMPAADALIFAAAHPARYIVETAKHMWHLVRPRDSGDEAFMGPVGIVEAMKGERAPDAASLLELACLVFALLAALDAVFIAVTVAAAVRGGRRSATAR
jgi:hypothetical protein